MNYPGGKNGAGVFQSIINLMPRHDVYIEAFLGSGAVLRNKRPARRSIGIEIDPEVCRSFWESPPLRNFKIINGNAVEVLKSLRFDTSSEAWFDPYKTLIYLDPPYLKSVRSTPQKIYEHEFMTEDEHIELLKAIKNLPCNAMISGYQSELYDAYLFGWRKSTFHTTNRAGKRTTETVWMNFAEPGELHDYQFLGDDFRRREKIRIKRNLLKQRLLKMDRFEALALIETAEEVKKELASPV